jgi:hypothetical protein
VKSRGAIFESAAISAINDTQAGKKSCRIRRKPRIFGDLDAARPQFKFLNEVNPLQVVPYPDENRRIFEKFAAINRGIVQYPPQFHMMVAARGRNGQRIAALPLTHPPR